MKNTRYLGLDSLRFVAALWVMMGHCAIPPLTAGHDPTNQWAWALNGFWNGSISGPAAVIVFFVISGFCIHLPFAEGKPFRLTEFLVRRWIRIIVPMVVAVLTYRAFGGKVSGGDPLTGVPAWSLICEIIYYGLYPILLWLRPIISFRRQFVVAFVVAFLFSLTKPIDNVNYPAWGYALDWILGLPCWFLGVLLANSVRRLRPDPKPSVIWRYRAVAIMFGAVTHNLALQQVVGQHLTLNFFALFVYVWLKKELAYYSKMRKPWAWLEWAGTWSYSLYLLHITASNLFDDTHLPMLGWTVNWLIQIGWILSIAYLFYLVVERPSHQIARFLGQKLSE